LIERAIGTGSSFGLKTEYAFDGPRLLGTGGALRRALPILGDAFFVLYGDSYLPIAFDSVQAAFERCGRPALMTLIRNDNQWDRSNVRFEGGAIREYNKRAPTTDMFHIDYGLGILSASVLDDYPLDHPFDLADVYHRLSLQGLLAGYEVFDRFYEIGTPEGLMETEAYLTKTKGCE
jgi:NDP-sugar pyrophosphorylase family protein